MKWLVPVFVFWTTSAIADHELDNRDIAAGRVLYAENCAVCHGAKLEGQPDWRTPGEDGLLPAPPHDASGHTWHHDTAMLFDFPPNGFKPPASSRSASANLSLIFSPEL